jgi:ribosomal protein S18 acetylase RimI-like enzyme
MTPALVSLVPMSEAGFEAYAQLSIADHAEQSVASGRWPVDSAASRARDDFAQLLPAGRATPDHHLFDIRRDDGTAVGALWLGVVETGALRSGYLYEIRIHPEHRRRGYASAAFREAESFARDLGLATIGLHVFDHNRAARALYEQLGYSITGINMQKSLIESHARQS